MIQPTYFNSNSVLCVVEYLLEKLKKSVTEPVIEIQDQTGMLTHSLDIFQKFSFQAKEWTIIPYQSVIDLRKLLWENKPLRIILILPKDANRTALADILASRHPKVLIADSASILNGLAGLDLPSDEQLTPLLPQLVSKLELLKRYYKANLKPSDVPAFILSVLLDSDVFVPEAQSRSSGALCPPFASTVFAQVSQGKGKLPKEAEPFIEEYISVLPKEWRDKIGQLLRFSANRSNVLAELLKTYTQLSGGGLGLMDVALMELMGENQSQEQLQEWAKCIRQALFAVPLWGRKVALKADSGDVTDRLALERSEGIDYLKSALEYDIKKQVREIVDGRRSSLTSAWWGEHLFASEMEDSIKVAKEIAALMDVLTSVSEIKEEAKRGDLGKARWAQWYSENGAYADLLWMRLKKQIPKVPWLADEIAPVIKRYQEARSKLNRLFAKELVENYKIWVNGKDVPTVANILNQFVKPNLQENKALLLIVDGLNYPVWRNIASDIAKRRLSLSEKPVISLLPTVTGVGRKAIFAGMSPQTFYPYLEEDETESQRGEETSLKENLTDVKIALFRKRHLNEQFAAVNSTISDSDVDLVCVILNEIDDALRAQSGDLTKNLDDLAYLSSLIQIGIDTNRVLMVASDHGFTPDGGEKVKLKDVKVKQDFDRFALVTDDVEAECGFPPLGGQEGGFIVANDLLYDFGGKVALLTDFGARLKIPHNGYHGGASLEEVIVPCAVITSGETASVVEMKITGIPAEVVEDSNVTFLLEVHAKAAPIEDLTVDLLLPSKEPMSFKEKAMEMGSWVKWEINWQPSLTLPSDEEASPQPQKATIRARITSPEALSDIETYCDTVILPKRGKTTRAVDELLPEF
ncbi:MAG: PglZ domain-containing protein [Waddliaceae bacterium]